MKREWKGNRLVTRQERALIEEEIEGGNKVIHQEMKRDEEKREEKKKDIRRTHLTAAFWKKGSLKLAGGHSIWLFT